MKVIVIVLGYAVLHGQTVRQVRVRVAKTAKVELKKGKVRV